MLLHTNSTTQLGSSHSRHATLGSQTFGTCNLLTHMSTTKDNLSQVTQKSLSPIVNPPKTLFCPNALVPLPHGRPTQPRQPCEHPCGVVLGHGRAQHAPLRLFVNGVSSYSRAPSRNAESHIGGRTQIGNQLVIVEFNITITKFRKTYDRLCGRLWNPRTVMLN